MAENTEQYTPSDQESAEGWALVDMMRNIMSNVRDSPHFTAEEHALMGAGEIQRDWLTAHDARVRGEALENPTEGAVLSLAIWMAASDGEVWVGPLDGDLDETDRDWYLDQAREALEVASNAQKSGVGVKS